MNKWIALFVLSLSCSACALSPEPDYFTLAPATGAISDDLKGSVKIQRPQLASYLDRPEFVQQENVVQIEMDESRFWAEPLDVMIERVLAADLRQRLPLSTVTTENTDTLMVPRLTIALDLQHFNKIEHDRVLLQGEVTLHGDALRDKILIMPLTLEMSTRSSGTAVAEALSALVGQMADKVVEAMESQSQVPSPEIP